MACMTHTCRRCGFDTFDNRKHGPVICPQCGSDDGTIDTWDEVDDYREDDRGNNDDEGQGDA